ncbi:hypothetical protein BGW42_003402 [Actinomortierella wolfii]|nr:hypothetical protein BGW42_003402 [Actinomortierella wolfii]
MATVGTYSGPSPRDPDADIRKIFTERENQQDGLGTILKYCQEKVGFTVGSSNTLPLRAVLVFEFSSILRYQPSSRSSASSLSSPTFSIESVVPEGMRIEDDPGLAAKYIPPHLPAYLKFLEDIRKNGYGYSSLIVFSTKDEGNTLSLVIDENHVIRIGSQHGVNAFQNVWIIDRDEMARQADWLVDKLRLKESLEDWNRKITSPGYS